MSRSVTWTPVMLATLHEQHGRASRLEDVAAQLGVSVQAVVARLDRLGLPSRVPGRRKEVARVLPSRSADPLPAGHPTSWGAITVAPWNTA